jgi:hypothetical protein
MNPTTSRLRLALLTLAFVCALALTGVIVQGPRSGVAGIEYLSFGKMHLDDISLGVITDAPLALTSRKAGGGQQDYP